jgi:hypothetical protein
LIEYTDLDNVHDDWEKGHDKDDLEFWVQVVEEIVAHAEEGGRNVGECEG